ncbi:MAG: bifunctional folylpolyglutamate synthase/dihydrofolate synthase [Bacteroidetes bacterium]|nr:bifunctional folylpolyglutamate synthase/dihydrofolate synthase [Bacteroidota bacterium]
MNYQQTLEYMFKQLPMFHRVGAVAYKADLKNTIKLCKLLKNPQNKFKSIHIAGTNGKGSTSHLLASVLQEAGYKVGLYTSPHLKDFRERIRINGEMIPKYFVKSFIEKYKTDFEEIGLSFFEMTVGLAFQHFANNNIDIAVIETGLGGRLDSTNIINPEISIITNISSDHKNLLGDTLEKIAFEKAGIIKSKTPVIIGESQKGIKEVFIEKAKLLEAPIFFADKDLKIENWKLIRDAAFVSFDVFEKNNLIYNKLHSPLIGNCQKKNILTVLKSIELLQTKKWKIDNKSISNGISRVVKNTQLLGRWQILGKNPLIICDTGHNEDGIKQILEQIKETPHQKLHFVLGMVNDKDIETILSLLPKTATYYFCKANIPRGLPAEELSIRAEIKGLYGNNFESVTKALESAKKKAHPDDLIFVGGSTFIVAEVV